MPQSRVYKMIIMKFGGSSVADEQKINNVAEIVKTKAAENPVVIVSALGGVTDSLIKAAKLAQSSDWKEAAQKVISRHRNVLHSLRLESSMLDGDISELENALSTISSKKQLSRSALDLVASFGERMSSKIVAACIRSKGMKCAAYNAYDIGMVTDSNFGNADILPETYGAIRREFSRIGKGTIPVITGYIGKDRNGEITTLGRGGSDYTASIIGAAICAEEIQIWTDVNGIMTADPRIVENALNVKEVSHKEASELAFMGAKVLHPKTILPAISKNIPVRILNTFNYRHKGTVVLGDIKTKRRVASIACKRNIKVINIYTPSMFLAHGFLKKVFGIFEDFKIPIDMISTSEINISVTVDQKEDITPAIEELKRIAEIEVLDNRAKVSLVGKNMIVMPKLLSRLFYALDGIRVEMISSSTSEINQSIVVNGRDADKAVRKLHKTFFGR